MLLGDGCIPKVQRGTNAYFRIGHSIKQKEYLMHKKEILDFFTHCRVYEGIAKLKGKEYGTISLDTRVHPFYTKLREHMYFQGRKTVDEHVLKCLTARGLAYLYQDDGCLIDHEGFLTPFICTHNFNKVEVELIARFLQKKFGLQFRTRKDKEYYSLRLRRMDREKFFDLIKPYVHESMMYKLRDDGKRATGYGTTLEVKCLKCRKEFTVPFRERTRKYCSCECYQNSKVKDV